VRQGNAEVFNCVPASPEIPPSAGIPFIQIDKGQTGPRFMRSTVTCAPAEQSLQSQVVPFGFVVQPLAEMSPEEIESEQANFGEVPVIDLSSDSGQEISPFRCRACQGFMNLHTRFSVDGQQATCHLCETVTPVTSEHFGLIDQHGKRSDADVNLQYKYGTFEYKLDKVAPSRVASPEQPLEVLSNNYVFCIDISATSIMNGFFYLAVTTLKRCLDYFPNPDNSRVFLLTYDQQI